MPASQIASQLGLERDQVILGATELPRLAAASIAQQDRPLVIAVDGSYPNDRSSRYPGIELLTWLRLKHKHNAPILLVGFQTAEDILAKHPEHLIMLAPGNRYERLPIEPNQAQHLTTWLQGDHALKGGSLHDTYAPYLKPAFDGVRFRHRLANIFGLKMLWDIHGCVDPAFKATYSDELNKAFDRVDALWAEALLSGDLGKVRHAVELHSAPIVVELAAAESRLQEVRQEFEAAKEEGKLTIQMMEPWQIQVDGIRSAMRLILDPADRATWQAKLDQLNADIAFSQELLEAAQRKESSKTIEAQAVETRIATIENDLQQVAHSLPLIANHRQSQDLNVDLTTLEVIHVDDEGLTGWFQVFKHIIHGNADGKYHEVVPVTPVNGASKESIEMAIEATAEIIEQKLAAKAEPPENGMRADQILFLDLRLFPSWDAHQRDPAAMSGALLLRRIRDRYMTLPIAVTTASNKVWSYQVMRDLGADAFWIKEGWDHDWSLEDSVRNYGRLRELAARATSPAVRALRVLEDLYHKVTAAPSPWWEHGYWRTGEPRRGDTSTAKMLHLSAIIQLRHYCQRYMYQELSTPTAFSAVKSTEGNANHDQRSVMISSVSVLVASIVEAILFGPDKMTRSSRELRRRIRYHPGVEILDIRGEAAHKELIGYDEKRLIHMIELLIDFFTKPISFPKVLYELTTSYKAYVRDDYVATNRTNWSVMVKINDAIIEGIVDHVDKPDQIPAKGVERHVYPMLDVSGDKYYFTFRKPIKPVTD